MRENLLGSGSTLTNGTRAFAGTTGATIRDYRRPPKGAGDPPDFAGGGAPCTRPEVDEDLWHPNGYEKAYQHQAEEAIALCRTCPMQTECLIWARQIKATHGIWGGVWIDYEAGSRNRKQRSA